MNNYTEQGIITIRINTDRVEAKHMVKGKKGNWLGMVMIPTPDSEYGNAHLIAQEVSEEDRLRGIKGNVLGNSKIFKRRKVA